MTEVLIDLDQPAPMIIHFYDQLTLLERWTDRYRTVYPIHLDSLAEVLGRTTVNSGILPQNTLATGKRNGEAWILRYIPPAMRTLHIGNTEKAFTVPSPPLVWFGCGQNYRLYALNTLDYPNQHTILFQAPYPNVNATGGICWGSTGTVLHANHDAMDTMLERFFASGFNTHLDNNRSRRKPSSVLDLWAELAKQQAESYPLDDLIACSIKLSELTSTEDRQ